MKTLNTIKHHLESTLPPDILALALKNAIEFDKLNLNTTICKKNHALIKAFTWNKTPEGPAYWDEIDDKYFLKYAVAEIKDETQNEFGSRGYDKSLDGCYADEID